MRQDIVHVRVVVPITTRGFRNPGVMRSLEGPGVVVRSTEVDTGPASIESEFALAAPPAKDVVGYPALSSVTAWAAE